MSRKLYVVARKFSSGKYQGSSLQQAATDRGFTCEYISDSDADFFTLPVAQPGDMVFRTSLNLRAKQIEQCLIRDGVGHVYRTETFSALSNTESYLATMRAGVPVIKTIIVPPNKTRDLDDYVTHLGGFPLVVKVTGRYKGVGVMRVDSIESLRSLLDYLNALKVEFMLRAFVPHQKYARVVVVGDKVVASHSTQVMENEFRTNAPGNIEDNKQPFTPNQEMKEAAIRATHAAQSNFGGVDFLLSDNDTYQIAEVNAPCNFASTERIAQVDIAGPLVDFLDQKAVF